MQGAASCNHNELRGWEPRPRGAFGSGSLCPSLSLSRSLLGALGARGGVAGRTIGGYLPFSLRLVVRWSWRGS